MPSIPHLFCSEKLRFRDRRKIKTKQNKKKRKKVEEISLLILHCPTVLLISHRRDRNMKSSLFNFISPMTTIRVHKSISLFDQLCAIVCRRTIWFLPLCVRYLLPAHFLSAPSPISFERNMHISAIRQFP